MYALIDPDLSLQVLQTLGDRRKLVPHGLDNITWLGQILDLQFLHLRINIVKLYNYWTLFAFYWFDSSTITILQLIIVTFRQELCLIKNKGITVYLNIFTCSLSCPSLRVGCTPSGLDCSISSRLYMACSCWRSSVRRRSLCSSTDLMTSRYISTASTNLTNRKTHSLKVKS